MARKAARKRRRSFRNAPRFKEWTSGTAGDWLKRWEAAAPHAAKAYAEAMRDQAEAAIAKYIQGLQLRSFLKRQHFARRPGA